MEGPRRDARRRVMSVDVVDQHAARNLSLSLQSNSTVPQRPSSLQPTRRNTRVSLLQTFNLLDDDSSPGSTSNDAPSVRRPSVGVEGQTDPNVLADLEKALKYKSRVEASLKTAKSLGRFSDTGSQSPSSSMSSGVPPLPMGQIPERRRVATMPGRLIPIEPVDFSPSVGTAPAHPVPTSSNDGATLDWSKNDSDEDKRGRKWPLSRKVIKEKSPPRRRALVEKQESIYSDKLSRIRAKANPQTLRKADITRAQLQRRYDALEQSFTSKGHRLNTADVARWFASQPESVKRLFDETEPLSWLRHLLQRSEGKSFQNLPWHLSALIVEEYIRSRAEDDTMSPIPEDASPSAITSTAGISPVLSHKGPRILSYPTSLRSLDARNRLSDDHISFEPLTHSRRNSFEKESHRSIEAHVKTWRTSLQGVRDGSSPPGSIHTSLLNELSSPRPTTMSPTIHPISSPALGRRIRWNYERSEDGSSSVADSLSEDPKSLDELSMSPVKRQTRTSVSNNVSPVTSRLDLRRGNSFRERSPMSGSTPVPILDTPRPDKDFRFPATSPASSLQPPNADFRLKTVSPAQSAKDLLRTARPLLPASPSIDAEEERRKKEAKRNALIQQYERKRKALDESRAQNTRIKILLQTAARAIRQFDDFQSILSNTLGLPYEGLTPSIFDAFGHDPAAITSNTHKLSGWRAVEEIHDRLLRQAEKFRIFLASLPSSIPTIAASGFSICDEHMERLSEMINELSTQFQEVSERVPEIQSAAEHVKELRGQLKAAFDATERHTSANYPELVRLDALLDRFDSKRNQLWKLGETSLSLVLSSLAPFMKTFGRPIWDDVHDFLVIPWYRNEFSGEDQWYPVKFPKRSVLHWIWLLCLAFSAPLGLLSTFEVVASLLTEVRLDDIPFLAPRLFIWTIFSLLIFIFLITILILSATVLGEVVMFFWWAAWFLRLVE